MIIIKDKKDCVGCAACYNRCPKKCITMEADEEGFLYPKVDLDSCVNCGLCEEVCPVLRLPAKRPVRKVYGCMNKEDSVRDKSTSGGYVSVISENILSKGGVVFGAAYDEDFSVHHICVETKEDLAKLRGSKYAQSRIEDTFKLVKKYLLENRQVLFSGTPCQIAGLRRFVGKEYDNLFLVDVVCHGVPSPKVYKKLLAEVEDSMGEKITYVNFRDKRTGWKTCSFVIKGATKEVVRSKQESLYMKAFLRGMSIRPSCYACRYNNEHSSADITVADYWGVETKFPELKDEVGITLVMINTLKGSKMFKELEDKARIIETDFEHAAENNFAIKHVSTPHENRAAFFGEIWDKPLEEVIEKLINTK